MKALFDFRLNLSINNLCYVTALLLIQFHPFTFKTLVRFAVFAISMTLAQYTQDHTGSRVVVILPGCIFIDCLCMYDLLCCTNKNAIIHILPVRFFV